MNRCISLLSLFALLFITNAQSYVNYTNLIDHVLQGYNPDVLPLNDHTKTLHINVMATFYSLTDVNVVKGTISFVLTLSLFWRDSQITWNPSEYGNITSLSLPNKKVWKPSIVVGSALEFTVIGDTWMPVSFSPNGSTIMTLGDVVKSGCSFNMRFWPFDKQTCETSFAAFGYSINQIRLRTIPQNSFSVSLINENVEWVLENAELFVREDKAVSQLVIRLQIKRRSDIFIILIIFPLYCLVCLNSMVFLLPSESGERIGFSATIMLSITVFLEVISAYIPNTSKPIPFLCIIVTLGITMSILSIITVIISLHFFHKDNEMPINGCLQNMVKLFKKEFRNSKVENAVQMKSEHLQRFQKDLTTKNFEEPQQICDDIASNEIKRIRWVDVSYTMDRVCFITGTFTHALIMIGFTLYLAIAPE